MNNSPQPSPPNSLPLWFLLLMAVGVPSATGLTFAKTVTQHPWQALGIALLYEVVFLFVAFMTRIWERLQEDWVNGIVGRWKRGRPFFYQRYYCKQLRSARHSADMRSIGPQVPHALELMQIFVPPNIDPEPADRTSPNPLDIPRKLPASRRSIWEYLRTNPHLVVLGAPGRGKSTLLQYISLTLIDQKKLLWGPKVPYKLPFLLFLRDYRDIAEESSSFSLVKAIEAEVNRLAKPAPPGWVESQLTKGHCLILLDGLDEVADPKMRRQVARWVQNQINVYGNNGFIITSRPYGYRDNPLTGVTSLEIKGFNDKQIKQFICNWYSAINAKHLGRNVPKEAEDLIERLFEPGNKKKFRPLATNPLLLTMIATVHRYYGALPGSRAELYASICKVYLEIRSRWEVPPYREKQRVLQELAFEMMTRGKEGTEIEPAVAQSIIKEPLSSVSTQITPETFLQMMENSGIWIPGNNPGTQKFVHLTFQEYLAAMHVKESNLEQFLVERVGSGWWHETILLYCTQVADASAIMDACLSENRLSENAIELALKLRQEFQEERIYAKGDVYENFIHALSQTMEGQDLEGRHKIAEALLNQRKDWLADVEEELVVDTSFIHHVEYQLFLDQREGRAYGPDHWKENRFPASEGLAPALGVRPSDAIAFCNWLTAYETSDWQYRLPKSDELQESRRWERLEERHVGTIGVGCWINEGKEFARVKGESPLSSDILQKQLDDAWTKDKERAENPYTTKGISTSEDKRLHLTSHIIIARNLEAARTLHRNLIDTLKSIRKLFIDNERMLKAAYDRTHNKTVSLQSQLGKKSQDKANFELQLKKRERLETNLIVVNQEKARLQKEFDQNNEDFFVLTEKFRNVDKKLTNLRNQLARTSIEGQKILLRNQITTTNNQKNLLHVQLDGKKQKKLLLESQIDEKRTLVSQLKNQINAIDKGELTKYIHEISRQESELTKQIAETSRQESEQKKEWEHFGTQSRAFYTICDRFLALTPTYNGNAYSNALTRNHVLNFDRVLSDINDCMEDLSHVDILVSTYLRDLAKSLTLYSRNMDINNINGRNIKSDIADTVKLLDRLKLLVSGEDAQKLGSILKSYLDHLDQSRPFGKERHAYARLYIRYFARVLADHLLYWSRKELSSPTEQLPHNQQMTNQHTIDTYFDLHVSFALLQERITGNFAASEGILIVRERRREDEEVHERGGNSPKHHGPISSLMAALRRFRIAIKHSS